MELWPDRSGDSDGRRRYRLQWYLYVLASVGTANSRIYDPSMSTGLLDWSHELKAISCVVVYTTPSTLRDTIEQSSPL